jgi:hypothetical protein
MIAAIIYLTRVSQYKVVRLRMSNKDELRKLHGGLKFSKGKNRLGLLLRGFAPAIWELGWVCTKGASKYEDNSWQHVPDACIKYEDALARHLNQWRAGADYDEEFGTHHLAHVAWNALAILTIRLLSGEVSTLDQRKLNNNEDMQP